MAANSWFRLYSEMLDNEKIGTLKDSEFRLYIEILCVSCEANLCGNSGKTSTALSWRLRYAVDKPLKELLKRNLISLDDDGVILVNGWEKRQFPSDSSKERTRNYRERISCDVTKKVTVTSQKRHSDALYTDTDTDTNTDTDIYDLPNGKSLSGKPDALTPNPSNLEFKKQAIEVIEFLNEKTGRRYRTSDTNLKFVIGRLKSGATVSNCRMVIAKKYREWKDDPKMMEYVRPATLFNATKFEQYLGELG